MRLNLYVQGVGLCFDPLQRVVICLNIKEIVRDEEKIGSKLCNCAIFTATLIKFTMTKYMLPHVNWDKT